jgi:hypothetical protein
MFELSLPDIFLKFAAFLEHNELWIVSYFKLSAKRFVLFTVDFCYLDIGVIVSVMLSKILPCLKYLFAVKTPKSLIYRFQYSLFRSFINSPVSEKLNKNVLVSFENFIDVFLSEWSRYKLITSRVFRSR